MYIEKKATYKTNYLLIRAISHKIRLTIIEHLHAVGSCDVLGFYREEGSPLYRTEQSVVSQHLRILRDAHVVETVRVGKNINYKLTESGKLLLANSGKPLDTI